jgi:hypothetical protein
MKVCCSKGLLHGMQSMATMVLHVGGPAASDEWKVQAKHQVPQT